MEIAKNIEIIDLCLYLKKENILILADTHIGYEEALNKQGILIPRFQFKEIIERLEKTLQVLSIRTPRGGWRTSTNNIKQNVRLSSLLKNNQNNNGSLNEKINKLIFSSIVPNTSCRARGLVKFSLRSNFINNKKLLDKIIINGDIKHEFGTISEQEWRHTLGLLDFLSKYCNEIILVKGNHDTILGPIAKKRNVKILDSYKIKDLFIVHGNKMPDKEELRGIKKIIIGHEHPAVSVHEGVRQELFKCFLKGEWSKRILIVQPSFNLVTEGTDVLKEELLSPFLQQDLGNFKCFIVADKIYEFGKLEKLS